MWSYRPAACEGCPPVPRPCASREPPWSAVTRVSTFDTCGAALTAVPRALKPVLALALPLSSAPRASHLLAG